MEEIYESGKARAIGVSNWRISGLEALTKTAKIKPHVNQIEIHPFLPNTKVVEYCQTHNIVVEAYSPLGSQNQVPSTGERVPENATLNGIAQRKGCTLAQVLIAWGLRRGYVVLPKSSIRLVLNRIFSRWSCLMRSSRLLKVWRRGGIIDLLI